jgi:hypothetical protein
MGEPSAPLILQRVGALHTAKCSVARVETFVPPICSCPDGAGQQLCCASGCSTAVLYGTVAGPAKTSELQSIGNSLVLCDLDVLRWQIVMMAV